MVTDSEWMIRNREPQTVYFPETVEVELKRYPRISEIEHLMQESGSSEITESMVEFQYELRDNGGYRSKVFASLLLISDEDFQRTKSNGRGYVQGPDSRSFALFARFGREELKFVRR